MVHDASTLPLPGRLRADLVVVGSGPGGAAAATIAAEAGLSVVLLEAGGWITPGDMNQREDDMLPRLLWHAGGRTTSDRAVRIHQGRGVGGSSLHNISLCKRIPGPILAEWQARRGLSALPPDAWAALYDEVEALLGVTPIPEAMWNRHNRLLERACEVLGWRGGGLSYNRTGCIGAGFCEIGCSYDAKNNAFKVFIPRFVRAGGQVLHHCQAVRVLHRGGEVRGVEAVALDPVTYQPSGRGAPAMSRVTIEAPRVCLAGSATGTAALLLRSEVPDPGGETGNRLHVHPAVVVAGDFDEPVEAWLGVPQSYECTEWLDFEAAPGDPRPHRAWIVPAFGHPMGVATLLPGHGELHRSVMRRYRHLGALTAMVHDHTAGEVRPAGDLDVRIDYRPDAADARELSHGLAACAKLLFAAGARRVLVPTLPIRELTSADEADALTGVSLDPGHMELTAVHPMGSVPMGDDPAVAAVGSNGAHHHLAGLWVSDGSLFPGSVGVPPQISIYALGLHVGRSIVGTPPRVGGARALPSGGAGR